MKSGRAGFERALRVLVRRNDQVGQPLQRGIFVRGERLRLVWPLLRGLLRATVWCTCCASAVAYRAPEPAPSADAPTGRAAKNPV